MESIANQLMKTAQDLQRLSVAGTSRGKGKRRPPVVVVEEVAPSSARRKRKKKKRTNNPVSSSISTTRLVHTEFWKNITTVKANEENVVSFSLYPSAFEVAKLHNNFSQRFRANKVVLEYRPMVGTTIGGGFSMGVDWSGSQTGSMTRAKISALSPNCSCVVSQGCRLVLPASALQTRQWYTCTDVTDSLEERVAVIWVGAISAQVSTVGELWCHYDFTFEGLRPSA